MKASRDLDLTERLGFDRPHEARRLIERNRDELEMHGGIFVTVTKNTGKRGRPGKAYYLNEGQALVICALSRTANAALIRKALIDVFTAYRRGEVVEVKAHRRKKPTVGPRFRQKVIGDFRNMSRDDLCETLANMFLRIVELERDGKEGVPDIAWRLES